MVNDSGVGNSFETFREFCSTLRSDAKVPQFSVATLADYSDSGAGDSKQQ